MPERARIRLLLKSIMFPALALVLLTRWCHGITSIPGVITEGVTREKVVALTFDDGPHPVFTPEILALLERYQAKATFFVIGSQARRYPAIVRTIAAKGHEIGNHTYSHPRNLELASNGRVEVELDECAAVLQSLTGKRPVLFRPPHGFANAQVVSLARRHGCKTVLWSVCADNHAATTPNEMARRVLDRVFPGCIILIHDGGTGIRWKDVQAAGLILDSLKANGYSFVTITDLLKESKGRPPLTDQARSQTAQDRNRGAGIH